MALRSWKLLAPARPAASEERAGGGRRGWGEAPGDGRRPELRVLGTDAH